MKISCPAKHPGPFSQLTRRSLVLMVLLLACGWPLRAEDARPKIGVVLSGGGARGFAHVGVLKVLDEMRIPVDYIAGTSMGAIVGGLYASGLPIDDLERLILESDWNGLLGNEIPRQELPFRRKQDSEAIFKVAFDPRKGAIMPQGLVSSGRLDILLKTLTLEASATKDFSQLPIPFKCIAADIASGQAITLDHGDLATAMRASMAVPGLFAPVELDEHVLVDGGILMNLPVETVKNMGADVVIAIDIGSPLVSREKLKGFIAITDQSRKVMTQRYYEEQAALLTDDDLLLTPDLKDLTSGDFGHGPELIELGYAAADAARASLARYSVSPAAYADFKQRQSVAQPLNIGFVEMRDRDRSADDGLRAKLQNPLKRMLDLNLLGYDIFKLSSLSDYEEMDLSMVEKDGHTGLLLAPRRKATGTSYLRVSLKLEDNFRGDPKAGLISDLSIPNLNRRGAEWQTRLELGNDRSLFSEFHQPLDAYAWSVFVAPNLKLASSQIDIYEAVRLPGASPSERHLDDDKYAEYRLNQAKAFLDMGLSMSTYGELRLGLYRGSAHARTVTGGAELPKLNDKLGGYRLRYTLDTLDNPDIPRQGGYLDLDFTKSSTKLKADESYRRLGVDFIAPFSWGNATLIPRLKAGTSFGNDLPLYDEFSLGGFLNLSGLSRDQLRANHMLLAQLIGIKEVWTLKRKLIDEVYLGATFEAGAVWDERRQVKLARNQFLYATCLFLGTDTRLGPLDLGYGYAEVGLDSVYVRIGNIFFK